MMGRKRSLLKLDEFAKAKKINRVHK